MNVIQTALLSVSDKSGIVEFARVLNELGIRLISTGGTYTALREAQLPVTRIDEVTGFPEILDGRVKTLHPAIHGGLLARRDLPQHMSTLTEHGIAPIDLVVVNLYPFRETVASGKSFEECVEQIDIGGPSMLRSAAKNHESVTVICDPHDYPLVAEELQTNRDTTPDTRRMLAQKVFAHTSAYDAAIERYLSGAAELPARLTVLEHKFMDLRYGENPHQTAALYGGFMDVFESLHGKELSFNNIVDIQAAAALVGEFSEPASAIIKHTNPCGCAIGGSTFEAYSEALTTDPVSAFGGIVACNREVDLSLAEKLNEMFLEVVVAPSFSTEGLAVLMKKRDRRLIRQRRTVRGTVSLDIKTVANGYLCQTIDSPEESPESWKTMTRRSPDDREMRALQFAWKVAKHVKSNAIVYTNDKKTLGIGAGQMSRVDSSAIAVMKSRNAGLDLKHSVVASDAFFPFADGLLEAVKAGATAVIQPGGSVRDEEVIAAADEHGIAMVFTGIRHFKH